MSNANNDDPKISVAINGNTGFDNAVIRLRPDITADGSQITIHSHELLQLLLEHIANPNVQVRGQITLDLIRPHR